MWPSWLWVTPLGEVPALHVWCLRQGRCAAVCSASLFPSSAKSARCRHMGVISARARTSCFSTGYSMTQAAAAWCAALRMASLTFADSLLCALQGYDTQ